MIDHAHNKRATARTVTQAVSLSEEDAARAALAATGCFAPDTVRAARLTRLEGLTNRVYKVELADRSLCLRIPGEGTAAIIDRRAEAAIARAAATVGIAPEVLYFDADGVMLTRFVEGAVTLSARRFHDDPGAVRRAAQALARLHADAPDFPREFNVFEITGDYLDLLQSRGSNIPDTVPELMGGMEEIRRALAVHPAALRPCHCDPTGANLLDDGARIWLIDWEYAGMNDPMWDLAYLSVQSSFDCPQDKALLTAYLGRQPQDVEASRMAVHVPLVEFLSALWALIQHQFGNQAADFHSYALAMLDKCRERIRSAEFFGHLQTAQRG